MSADAPTPLESALLAALPGAIALVTLGVQYAIGKKLDPKEVTAALAAAHAGSGSAIDALDAEVAATRAKDDA